MGGRRESLRVRGRRVWAWRRLGLAILLSLLLELKLLLLVVLLLLLLLLEDSIAARQLRSGGLEGAGRWGEGAPPFGLPRAW